MTVEHDRLLVSDKIALVGELEHAVRHAKRSCAVATEKDEKIKYASYAITARDLRRKYMAEHFPDVSDKDWCLCKLASSIRQLTYETGEVKLLDELESFVDEVWGDALDMDLTGCEACKSDREASE